MRPDYGIDSPGIVVGQFFLALLGFSVALITVRFRFFALAAGIYFLYAALNMIYYSKVGKLKLRERLLDLIPWRGDEQVLDVGCGKGLLLAAAGRRLSTGKAIGVDLWLPHAITGNGMEAVLRNAAIEGVSDRVEVKRGDVRLLPFPVESFDVVVSNFVLHEMQTPEGRRQMLGEIVRVLRPGGRLLLVDFIFTKECVGILRSAGMADAIRTRMGGFRFWAEAVLMFGTFQLCSVTASKPGY
ncbi:MAG TPA: class I SAM-dependent methyltransferase [Bryobacteraceae bacterium]|nr:class I SAM-dependent methyltransferase [Bryobacteraceae bacterium]